MKVNEIRGVTCISDANLLTVREIENRVKKGDFFGNVLYLRCTNRHLNSTLLPLVFQIILQDLKESDNENVPKDFSLWCQRISPVGAEGFLLVVPIEASLARYSPRPA